MSPEHAPFMSPTAPTCPRIVVVSRRSIRKDKYVDFVGEYHLDLLTRFNAMPIIVPRVRDIIPLLSSLYPIHGLLLTEGEDVGPDHLPVTTDALTVAETVELLSQHPSDAKPDPCKDSIEFYLVNHCLHHSIPILAICRGSQVVNLASGGTLYYDIASTLGDTVNHIAYNNYDGHRHDLHIVPQTPMHDWFDGQSVIRVNSYHHQGIDQLAPRFSPMAYAPDGLLEGYYDASMHDVENGHFVVGLQFHPERMQSEKAALDSLTDATDKPVFEYEGCVRAYRDFVAAAAATLARTTKPKISSPSVAVGPVTPHMKQLRTALSEDDVGRLLRAGATVRGATLVRRMLDASPSTPIASTRARAFTASFTVARLVRGQCHTEPRGTVEFSSSGHGVAPVNDMLQKSYAAAAMPHVAGKGASETDMALKVRDRLRDVERTLHTLRGEKELATAERLLDLLSLLVPEPESTRVKEVEESEEMVSKGLVSWARGCGVGRGCRGDRRPNLA